MIAPEVAVEKLLGFESAAAIASFLWAEEVQGRRGSANSCPVAEWLTRVTGYYASVAPTDLGMRVGDDDFPVWTWGLGAPLHAFVKGFDHGKWPELDAEQ